MKKRVAVFVLALGFVPSMASPAAASPPIGVAHYNEEGDYVGCTSLADVVFYYPNEITEYGCTYQAPASNYDLFWYDLY
jgi:hypothetical protein